MKTLESNIAMIQNLLRNIQTPWMMVIKNTDNSSKKRKRKILIVFFVIIADIKTNKKFQSIVKELDIRCWKLMISQVPKNVMLNSAHYLMIYLVLTSVIPRMLTHRVAMKIRKYC